MKGLAEKILSVLHRPELVYLYAKNTNINYLFAALFVFIFLYIKIKIFYFYPTYLDILYISLLHAILVLFLILYKSECIKIKSNKRLLNRKFFITCIKLTYIKTIIILALLAICFWPLNNPNLYNHITGFAAAFCLLVLFSSAGSAYYLFLLFDTSVIVGFVMIIINLNLTGTTAETFYWAFSLFGIYGLILGWIINQSTQNMLYTQKKLKAASLRSNKAFNAKSEFLATMSHEIRTPINGIMGMSDFLSNTKLTDEQKEYISAIEYCTKSLLNTLNDVLDISKMEAGKLTISKINIDFHSFLEKINIVFQNNAQAKNIHFVLSRDDKIPSIIFADPNRLSQIINNLLNNALKFTEKGYVSLTVSLDDKNMLIKFLVQDSGIGIKKEDQALLFKRFSQVDGSISRKFGGTGLGLSIVYNLVKEMNGEIGVDSKFGEGSTFWFTIPYEKELLDTENIIQSQTDEYDFSYFKGLNILVVDDNDLNHKIVKKYLENAGVNVSQAFSGGNALEKINTKKYDLVLMDLQMPDIDGYEATRRIKANKDRQEIPIIALSANVLNDTLQKCYEVGMDGHISKPINKDELFSKIFSTIEDSLASNKKLIKEVINKNQISTITEEFGPDYAQEFVKSSFEVIEKQIVLLNIMIVNGSLDNARNIAHNLVSITGNIGMSVCPKISGELEFYCQNWDQEFSSDLFTKLRRQYLLEKKNIEHFLKEIITNDL